ncbi:MAG: AbrB/MazE/SpoVT family DNA-binding domain-containing protein [Bacilli bacterium]|nr:AbrB/MazE/SpoVT family DNA-binding domain-containing protein [Bacilli bacterium]
MKATGITRKIDELGRIVIPKEIRRNLGIRDGETLEIFTENDSILLKKHSVIHNFEELGEKLCNITSAIIPATIMITDREKVIASSNNKEYIGKILPSEWMKLIDNREVYKSEYEEKVKIDNQELNGYFAISPIISSIDSLGLIIIITNTNTDYMNISKLTAKIMADKLDIY